MTWDNATRIIVESIHNSLKSLSKDMEQLREVSQCPPDASLVDWLPILIAAWERECEQQNAQKPLPWPDKPGRWWIRRKGESGISVLYFDGVALFSQRAIEKGQAEFLPIAPPAQWTTEDSSEPETAKG